MVPEDPRGRGAGQAGAARPDAVDGRVEDQLRSSPGPPPSQLRIVNLEVASVSFRRLQASLGEGMGCCGGHRLMDGRVDVRHLRVEEARAASEPIAVPMRCQVEVQVRDAGPEDVDVRLDLQQRLLGVVVAGAVRASTTGTGRRSPRWAPVPEADAAV